MNISTSECSSGGESGWTMYLDQISSSTDQYNNNNNNTSVPLDPYDYRIKGKFKNQEEDEDLSMISDASSGPPQYFQQEQQEEEISENTRYISAISGSESKKGKHKKKAKDHRRRTESLNFHLEDDTASSPAFNFTKNNAALEHDKSLTYYHHSVVSASHLKGKSVLGKQLRFFKP